MENRECFDPSAVRAEMARRNLTIEDLADLAGLSAGAVQKIISERGNPTAESISKIAFALKVKPGLFFAPHHHNSSDAIAV